MLTHPSATKKEISDMPWNLVRAWESYGYTMKHPTVQQAVRSAQMRPHHAARCYAAIVRSMVPR